MLNSDLRPSLLFELNHARGDDNARMTAIGQLHPVAKRFMRQIRRWTLGPLNQETGSRQNRPDPVGMYQWTASMDFGLIEGASESHGPTVPWACHRSAIFLAHS